jgi:hypothetical protein
MRRWLALALILAASHAYADQSGQRIVPGMSMSLQGELLDLNAPICSPAAGSYSVVYRNSIATGCTTRASDDFATLVFAGASAATYTMPQSVVSTFTGSISGTTLSTPSNAVTIGSVITGLGVLDNTYVTAGSGTTWTVNNSQTVGSTTLTQAVFPPGHGSCFKNNGTALMTITATTSTISGAAGVVNGNPAVTGGQIVLYPGGEVCLQANPSNNYVASGFLPGTWYQSAASSASVSSFQWLGLSGYPRLHLACSGVGLQTASGGITLQLAYAGTFQTAGYSYILQLSGNVISPGDLWVSTADGGPSNGFLLSSPLPTGTNNGATLDIDLSFSFGTGMGFSNDIHAVTRSFDTGSAAEQLLTVAGVGPLTTSQATTGIKLFPAAGTMFGMCWLSPRTS